MRSASLSPDTSTLRRWFSSKAPVAPSSTVQRRWRPSPQESWERVLEQRSFSASSTRTWTQANSKRRRTPKSSVPTPGSRSNCRLEAAGAPRRRRLSSSGLGPGFTAWRPGHRPQPCGR
eukprot:Amastigsp_a841075_1883.p4 type:complete len:119 gc:universal Amastigsp_a841075_1883:145-501(+)